MDAPTTRVHELNYIFSHIYTFIYILSHHTRECVPDKESGDFENIKPSHVIQMSRILSVIWESDMGDCPASHGTFCISHWLLLFQLRLILYVSVRE